MAMFNPSDPNAGAFSLASDEQIRERRRQALASALNAGKPRQNTHWAQVLAQALDGVVSGMEIKDADRQQQSSNEALARALEGFGSAKPAASAESAPSMPAATATASPSALPSADAKSAYDGLIARGLSPTLAAAAVGNFSEESGFKTGIWGDNGTSFGLGQWRGDRLTALRQLAAAQGKDPSDVGVQLDHFVNELKGPEARAFKLASAAKTPEEAALALAQHYERPAAWALQKSGPKRAAFARGVFDRFGGGAVAADLPAPGASPVQLETGQPGFAIPGGDPPMTRGSAPEVPLQPAFTAEGASQPWMGAALADQAAAPAPQQVQQAPMPPPRPADLGVAADPRADLPALGAAQTMMPAPPQIGADLANAPDAGMRALQVQAEQQRQGQPAGEGLSLPQRLASILDSGQPVSAPSAPSPQRLGAALTGEGGRTGAADPRMALGLALIRGGNRQSGMAMVTDAMKPQSYGFQVVGDQLVRTNPRTGQVEPVSGVQKKSLQVVDIGTDPQTGATIRGTFDPATGETKRIEAPAPGQAAAPSTIPPVPAGVDPKVWREHQSKRAAEEGLPASFDDTAKVRNELAQRPAYKNIAQAAPIYRAMLEAAGRDTKAADLNMVYGLGKIMDPGSVVREGEIHMANDTQGLADRLNGFIKAIQGEGRLRPEARAQIMAEAHGRMQSYAGLYNQDADFYRGIASKNRMDPAQIVQDFGAFDPWQAPKPAAAVPLGQPAAPAAPGAPVAAPQAGPKAGDVDGGYRFKGGDPSKPENWERVQ